MSTARETAKYYQILLTMEEKKYWREKNKIISAILASGRVPT
jgi:hypothetical protein